MGPIVNTSDLFRSIPVPSAPTPPPQTDKVDTHRGFKDYLDSRRTLPPVSSKRRASTTDRAHPSAVDKPDRLHPSGSTQDAASRAALKTSHTDAAEQQGPRSITDSTKPQSETGESTAFQKSTTESQNQNSAAATLQDSIIATVSNTIPAATDPSLSLIGGDVGVEQSSKSHAMLEQSKLVNPSQADARQFAGAIRPLTDWNPAQAPVPTTPVKEAFPLQGSATQFAEQLSRGKPADRPDDTTALQPDDVPIKVPVQPPDSRQRGESWFQFVKQPPTFSRPSNIQSGSTDGADEPVVPSVESLETFAMRKENVAKSSAAGQDARQANSNQATAEGSASDHHGPADQQGSHNNSGTRMTDDLLHAHNRAEVTVRASNGDPAAASLARLLVESDHTAHSQVTSGSSDTNLVTAPASRHHVSTSQVVRGVSQGSTAAMVGELLAAPTLERMPVDVAARLLNQSLGQGRHQAILRLDPPELGQLRIDIRLHAEGMVMRVDVEHAAAAKLIESRLGDLRETLAGHGIRVDRAEVIVRSPETDHQPGAGSGELRHGRSDAGESDRHGAKSNEQSWGDDSPRSQTGNETGFTTEGWGDFVQADRPAMDEWLSGSRRVTRSPVNLVA